MILDLILAVPMVWLMVKGWKRGLVREVATLVGVLVGIWAAVHLSQWVASLLGLYGESAVVIAFFLTFVGALVLAYMLGRAVEGLMKVAKLSLANKISGATLGMVTALCILSVVLGGVVMLDKKEKLITPNVKTKSLLYKPVYVTGSRLTDSLRQFVADHKDEALKTLKKDNDKQPNTEH